MTESLKYIADRGLRNYVPTLLLKNPRNRRQSPNIIVNPKGFRFLDQHIRNYFGSLVRDKLKEMLRKRIADKDILRLIGKWLKVGVLDEGRMLLSEHGTYQGSVISPLLANIYLHEVLDKWIEDVVKPRMRGEITLFRFCDDFIVCFQYRGDAEQFYRVLPKRFEKFGLRLHPKKTRLMAFGRFAESEARRIGAKPSTFCFLGFTFIGQVLMAISPGLLIGLLSFLLALGFQTGPRVFNLRSTLILGKTKLALMHGVSPLLSSSGETLEIP